jgi:hypothetical protein
MDTLGNKFCPCCHIFSLLCQILAALKDTEKAANNNDGETDQNG